MANIAAITAKAGDPRRARTLADTIGDEHHQAEAFVAIALRSNAADARQLIVSVLQMHKWIPVLGALARIEPEALRAIVDDLSGEKSRMR